MPNRINKTVVFIDLSGSTTLFEAIGDEAATKFVHGITKDIATHLISQGGRVLKFLGDGVMSIFDSPADAVLACLPLHEVLNKLAQVKTSGGLQKNKISLRIGMDYGRLIEVENDAYGDTVNVASRVMSLAKPGEMMLTAEVYEALPQNIKQRCRRLGRMMLRGRTAPQLIYGLELFEPDTGDLTQFHEMGSTLISQDSDWSKQTQAQGIRFSFNGVDYSFSNEEMPITIGRSPGCNVVIDDTRVSRSHVQIDFIDSQFYVTDISINGTMVQYGDEIKPNAYPITIRRQRCVLVRHGRIILGVWNPGYSESATPPTVYYQILNDNTDNWDALGIRLPGV